MGLPTCFQKARSQEMSHSRQMAMIDHKIVTFWGGHKPVDSKWPTALLVTPVRGNDQPQQKIRRRRLLA
jgi:hypothetical protein